MTGERGVEVFTSVAEFICGSVTIFSNACPEIETHGVVTRDILNLSHPLRGTRDHAYFNVVGSRPTTKEKENSSFVAIGYLLSQKLLVG